MTQPIEASINSVESVVSVTAAMGSAGQALTPTQSSSIRLARGYTGGPIEYKVGTAGWVQLDRNEAIDLSIDLSVTTVMLRKATTTSAAIRVHLKVNTIVSTGPTPGVPLAAAAPVTISGGPFVGSVLAASIAAGWQNTGGNWTRNGTAISGATSLTYTLVSADVPGPVTYKSSNIPYIPPGLTISAGSTPALVIKIIPLLAQSNQVGQGTFEAGVDLPSIGNKQFASAPLDPAYRTLIDAAQPLHHPMGVQPTLMGLGVNFATQHTANTGEMVALVPLAWNSTSMVGQEASWDPETGARWLFALDQLTRAVAAVQAAYPSATVSIGNAIWLGGESDGDDGVSQAVYQARMTDFIYNFRSSGLPGASTSAFTIVSMVPEAVSTRPGLSVIDAAHKAIPALVPRTVFVPGISGNVLPDNLHYNNLALRQLGINGANAYPTAMANTGSAAVAPTNVALAVITGAWVQGQTLTVSKGYWAGAATAWAYQWKRAGAAISGATAAAYILQAADVGNAITCDVIASNSAGTSSAATSAATPAVLATGSAITYSFEADTVNRRPVGIKASTNGRFVAASTGLPSGWTGQAARFSSSAVPNFTSGALIVDLLNAPMVANQTVVWRRGSTSVGNGRDAMVLRAVPGSVCTAQVPGSLVSVAGAKQGYEFLVLGQGGQLRINRHDPGAITQLGTSFTLADAADRYFRASVIGSALLFEYSADKVTWNTAISVTDTTFAAAGGVQYLGGLGGNSPTTVFIDDVTVQ